MRYLHNELIAMKKDVTERTVSKLAYFKEGKLMAWKYIQIVSGSKARSIQKEKDDIQF